MDEIHQASDPLTAVMMIKYKPSISTTAPSSLHYYLGNVSCLCIIMKTSNENNWNKPELLVRKTIMMAESSIFIYKLVKLYISLATCSLKTHNISQKMHTPLRQGLKAHTLQISRPKLPFRSILWFITALVLQCSIK